MPSSAGPNRSTGSAESRGLRVGVACRGDSGAVHVIELSVPDGSTVGDVIRRSGILDRCPAIDSAAMSVGIFNRACTPDDPVRDGDRVEIYEALRADPKEARRRRARRGRAKPP